MSNRKCALAVKFLGLQTGTGNPLGVVPPEKYAEIPTQACQGTIRSLRRSAQGGEVQQILVRIQTKQPGARQSFMGIACILSSDEISFYRIPSLLRIFIPQERLQVQVYPSQHSARELNKRSRTILYRHPLKGLSWNALVRLYCLYGGVEIDIQSMSQAQLITLWLSLKSRY